MLGRLMMKMLEDQAKRHSVITSEDLEDAIAKAEETQLPIKEIIVSKYANGIHRIKYEDGEYILMGKDDWEEIKETWTTVYDTPYKNSLMGIPVIIKDSANE